MTQTFDYDDGNARAGANHFDQVGQTLAKLASNLRNELSSDAPWSNDQIGSAFNSDFQSDRTTTISNVEGFAHTVQAVGPALTNLANTIMSTQQEKQ